MLWAVAGRPSFSMRSAVRQRGKPQSWAFSQDARRDVEKAPMTEELVRFLKARFDEKADLARRCDGDGCGQWSPHGDTVDFCQADLSGFHPTVARHVALHDPARVLREVEAKRRILARHARDPWPCHDLRDLASAYTGHPDFPTRA
ncbi:DUF6221 family protein [Streptomyces koyangensis]